MSWHGWFTFDGNEVINVERTEAYAKHAGASWFNPVHKIDTLHELLGDQPYTSPLNDNAPWVDPNDPNTFDFFGCYPLDITGLEDSTRSSTPIESTLDGGIAGKLRHTTRAVVFSCVLVGASGAAVDAGMRWLKSALLAGPCTDRTNPVCVGATMCYLSSEPHYLSGQASACQEELLRNLFRVVVNSGPQVTDRKQLTNGAEAWTVSFTAVAGVPWEFSSEYPIAIGFGDPLVANPMVVDAAYDLAGHTFAEVSCAPVVYQPVYDPACPAIVPPPIPPSVPVGCFNPPTNWTRRSFVIPQSAVPMWSDAVPLITVHATADVHNLRFRIFPKADAGFNPDTQPCSFCGDFLISFIPAGGDMVIDGTTKTITYETDIVSRRADSLVFASDGSPFDWPSMSCGLDYVVCVDALQTQVLPSIDVSVFLRAA